MIYEAGIILLDKVGLSLYRYRLADLVTGPNTSNTIKGVVQ